GFTTVNQHTTTQIATIAAFAQDVTGYENQRSTDLDFNNTQIVDQVDQVLVQQGAGGDNQLLIVRVDDVGRSHTAQNQIAQGLDNLTTIQDGFHGVAALGTAIVFGNVQILRHVDQTTSQVTVVSRLQGRISQTLTSTVSRNKVLQ